MKQVDDYSAKCSSCSNRYMGLDSYCNCRTTMVPVPSQVRTSSNVVVPVFGTISYDALTRSDSGYGGSYAPISKAYRTDCCNEYLTRSY